jgi:hypothetical protein
MSAFSLCFHLIVKLGYDFLSIVVKMCKYIPHAILLLKFL